VQDGYSQPEPGSLVATLRAAGRVSSVLAALALALALTGPASGTALPRSSALLGPVDKALAALIADGTVERLQRKWIKVHLDDAKELR
jgi:ABC-type amino acid transport substrate-binding protein